MPTTTTTTEPKYLGPTATAALLRKILRNAFPATRFSVTTRRGSGVSSVTVRYTDGPTFDRVNKIAAAFTSGSFDGMTDSFDYRTGTDRLILVDGITYERGTRYVSVDRDLSTETQRRAAAQVARYFGLEAPAIGDRYAEPTTEQDAAAFAATGHYWQTLIYQAANDATRYATTTEG